MTSYEFEKAAKNAAINVLKENDVEDISISDLNFVWFSYTLGNMKCTLYSPKIGRKYLEVTYNCMNDEMYVDLYEKIENKKIPSSQFNFEAEV